MTDLTTALLLIDVQVNMFAPESPVAGADTLISRLGGMLAGARAAGVPVVLAKTTCDTYASTPLAPALRARGVNRELGDRVIAVRAEEWSF